MIATKIYIAVRSRTITPAPVGQRAIAISISVCVSVREHISRFVHVSDDLGSVLLFGGVAIRFVLPVLLMTSCLHMGGSMSLR